MNNFEGLHPIMTAHYTLDWLTKFKVKDIAKLRTVLSQNGDIESTTKFINNRMRSIMNGSQLWWAISDKVGRVIGMVAIKNLATDSVTINYQIDPTFNTTFNLAEIKVSIDSLLTGINHQAAEWSNQL